ncbi:secreted protein [Candidatus Magnetobacterium bavaricum]|uniref:Secreted protein n=1 Tax=Candidatus Magnetobacterium bavaricum TaxID=29290 RepID=A0A0F3GWM9_9BACT|nr:secreted protein [Candidatus Magnetobacterium bavaricum]
MFHISLYRPFLKSSTALSAASFNLPDFASSSNCRSQRLVSNSSNQSLNLAKLARVKATIAFSMSCNVSILYLVHNLS